MLILSFRSAEDGTPDPQSAVRSSDLLKDQFKVHFLPTLCLLNGEEPAGNIVRIQNWGEYHNKFAEFVNDGYPAAGETANV